MDAYHATLVPMHWAISWQCDVGRWRTLDQCFALCVKIMVSSVSTHNMPLCGFTGIWLSGSLFSESAVWFLISIWNELISVQLDLWVKMFQTCKCTIQQFQLSLVSWSSIDLQSPMRRPCNTIFIFEDTGLVFWIDFQTICNVNGPDFIHSSKMDVEKYYQVYFEVWTFVRNMGDQNRGIGQFLKYKEL